MIPEGSEQTLEAIKRVAKARVYNDLYDPRIGASAADLGELFATGDQDLARAVFKSGRLARDQILSLRPRGVILGRGWDSSMLSLLLTFGLGGGALALAPEYQSHR